MKTENIDKIKELLTAIDDVCASEPLDESACDGCPFFERAFDGATACSHIPWRYVEIYREENRRR